MIEDNTKIFLGGSKSNWRSVIAPQLKFECVSPKLDDWSEDAQYAEKCQLAKSGIHLYVIDTHLRGLFSIAEMIQSSHDSDKITIIVIYSVGFTPYALDSLIAACNIAKDNGAKVFFDMKMTDLVKFINKL